MSRKHVAVLLALAVILASGVAVFLWCCKPGVDGAAYLPARPDLSGFAEVLQTKVARAETRVREGGEQQVEGLVMLGRLYHANGFLDEAGRCYEGLAALQPEEPRWFHRWATLTAGYGFLEEALPLWEYVIELAPEYLPARVRLGDALLKLNRPDEAEAVLRQALEIEPDNPYALLGLGRAAIARDAWAQARDHLERAARLSDWRVGVDLLASVYRELGEDARATNLLRTTDFGMFIDLEDPWMDALFQWCYDPYRLASAGGMAEFRGDVEAGLDYLERAVELDPSKALYHYQLAGMAVQLGQAGKAEKHYNRAIDLQPDLADAYVGLIALLDRLGRSTEAQTVLFRGYQACPDSPGMHMEMAQYMFAQGLEWRAMQELEEAAELRPNEAGAFLLMARIHIEQDRVEEAMRAMERALGAEPGHPLALSTLLLYAIETGDRSRADALMERVHLQPRMPVEDIEILEEKYRGRFGEAFGS